MVFESYWFQDYCCKYNEYCQIEVGKIYGIEWWLSCKDCFVFEYELDLIVFLGWFNCIDDNVVFDIGFCDEW